MSFLESLKISKKSRASLALVQGIATRPFSYLLSPLKISDQLRTRSVTKSRYSQDFHSTTRYKNTQQNDTIITFRQKKRVSVKARTIDFCGGRREESRESRRELQRKTTPSIKFRNGKLSKGKKEKGEEKRIHPSVSKYTLNGSLEMRISSLGIRTGTFQNQLETITASPKRLNSSQMSRDKQIRLMNSQASKLRQKQRSKNIKSMMLDDLKPWDSVGMDY